MMAHGNVELSNPIRPKILLLDHDGNRSTMHRVDRGDTE
jgi:hypothetical protein